MFRLFKNSKNDFDLKYLTFLSPEYYLGMTSLNYCFGIWQKNLKNIFVFFGFNMAKLFRSDIVISLRRYNA